MKIENENKTEAELLVDMQFCLSCQNGVYTCDSSRKYLELVKNKRS